MTVRRAFLEWSERGASEQANRGRLSGFTARDGAGMRFSADEDTTGRRNGFGQSTESMEAEGGGVGRPFCNVSFRSRSETRQNH